MQPAASPGPLDRRTSVADRAARVRFRRALALMLMTLLVPGSAQVVAGNRRVGLVAVTAWLSTLVLGGLTLAAVAVHHSTAIWLASTPWVLAVLRTALLAGAVGWALLFMDAWRIGQPLSLQLAHRRAAIGLNGVLCFAVAGVLLFGAHLVGVQRNLVVTMFNGSQVTGAHDGRFNVLLLGGDSGAGRWGLRTDSMTVASIDATTGKTVLIGLPRNMENFPFAPGTPLAKAFPHGYRCAELTDSVEGGCYLNSLATYALDHPETFGKDPHAGVDATISAIEGITGLKINYWAMVNLEGFRDLVDAVGGVRLDVRQPIPVGGLGSDVTGYIQPGDRVLDGHDVLWYARAREGSDDYSRMARQKCVMNAMLHQLSPQTVLAHFQDIAQASTAMVSTDIPASELDTFLGLALKARSQQVGTLSLVPPLVNTAEPDIALIRRKVAETIAGSEKPPAAKAGGAHKKKSSSGDVVTGGSVGSLSGGYAANQTSDLSSAC